MNILVIVGLAFLSCELTNTQPLPTLAPPLQTPVQPLPTLAPPLPTPVQPLPTLAPAPPPPVPVNGNCIQYTIQAGDTFYGLCQRYCPSYTDPTSCGYAAAANNRVSPTSLQIGQVVCLPSCSNYYTTCPANTYAFVVKPGTTYANICANNVQGTIYANPGVNYNNLQIGQTICLPYGCQASTYYASNTYCSGYIYQQSTCPVAAYCPGVYSGCSRVVAPGDTYWAYSRNNLACACQIQACTGTAANALRVGQIMNLPPCACSGYASGK